MFYINKTITSSAVDFAAEELKKYLRMMMPEGGDVKISLNPAARDGFRLGLMNDFGLDTSDAENTELDDILYIDTDERGGIIAGSNPRSVLLSVYEYFRQMGCRWLFPGVDGEYIPMKDITPVKYRKMADARVRGNCIEGFTSQNMLLDFIDFLPKVGLNTFMIQFRVPATFYDRYYTHRHNVELYNAEPVSTSQVVQWTAQLECEMEKRGLSLHSYGHGFTTDPFGIDSAIGWSKVNGNDFTEDTMKYFALLNGERKFFKDQPLNTQLCLSNRAARKKVSEYVADYASRHGNIDLLHIWLADSYNNHCECEECKKVRPSDLYVMLMNEVDEELTKRKLDTRIVFIVYVDTFWAPEKEKIKNPARFSLMMAPITRDFSQSFDETLPKYVTPPYVRNKLTMPDTLEKSVAHFKEWKKAYSGEKFVFEYHFWKPQCYDVSGRALARFIYNDIVSYRKLGFDGIIQCGSQRSFFPNGYAFYTHARALFDASLSLSEIEEDYYSHAYGEEWRKFAKVLESLAEALPYRFVSPKHAMARPETYGTADSKENIARARRVREDIAALVKEHYNSDVRVHTVSVRLLEMHLTYLEGFINIIEKKACYDDEGALLAFREFNRNIGVYEKQFENCFDLGQLVGHIEYTIVNLQHNDTE